MTKLEQYHTFNQLNGGVCNIDLNDIQNISEEPVRWHEMLNKIVVAHTIISCYSGHSYCVLCPAQEVIDLRDNWLKQNITEVVINVPTEFKTGFISGTRLNPDVYSIPTERQTKEKSNE